jgi:hypothetical protein
MKTKEGFPHAAPFVRLEIHRANERIFGVDHPDFATRSRAGQGLALNREGNAFGRADLSLAKHTETDCVRSSSAQQG